MTIRPKSAFGRLALELEKHRQQFQDIQEAIIDMNAKEAQARLPMAEGYVKLLLAQRKKEKPVAQ